MSRKLEQLARRLGSDVAAIELEAARQRTVDAYLEASFRHGAMPAREIR